MAPTPLVAFDLIPSVPFYWTRRQRAKYIVHAGLSDEFVQKTLGMEIKEHIQPLLKAMDVLNKATHVRAETIVHDSRDIRVMMFAVLSGVYNLLNAAEASREQMKRTIADAMHHAVFQNLISEYIQELDEISTHTSVDGHYIDSVEVSKMGATRAADPFEIDGTDVVVSVDNSSFFE